MDAPRPQLDVLVADADASVGELLLAVLRRNGYRADRVSDAAELRAALEAPEGARPRALLVERALPGCPVSELQALLDALGLGLPLLVTTAYLECEERRALCDAPSVTGVVDKPFELARLLADVAAALAQVPARRPAALREPGAAAAAEPPRSGRLGRVASLDSVGARSEPSARAWFPGASQGVPPTRGLGSSGLEPGASAC